jgi:hypothetical protein
MRHLNKILALLFIAALALPAWWFYAMLQGDAGLGAIVMVYGFIPDII